MTGGKLSRTIQAHKKTIRLRWCKRDYLVMSQKYRDIRKRCRSPMDSCFWCGHNFIDGEMMALAAPEKGLNKILCQECADKISPTQIEREK